MYIVFFSLYINVGNEIIKKREVFDEFAIYYHYCVFCFDVVAWLTLTIIVLCGRAKIQVWSDILHDSCLCGLKLGRNVYLNSDRFFLYLSVCAFFFGLFFLHFLFFYFSVRLWMPTVLFRFAKSFVRISPTISSPFTSPLRRTMTSEVSRQQPQWHVPAPTSTRPVLKLQNSMTKTKVSKIEEKKIVIFIWYS